MFPRDFIPIVVNLTSGEGRIVRNVFGFLLGSAIVAAIPTAANAQDYYAREHIAGLKPIGSPEASFSWSVGSWSDWSSTCARNAVRTRSVICRDGNGQAANDGACSGSKPESSQTQTQSMQPN